MKDGVYENMPFEEYAAIDAVNGSSIVHMRRSPMYYRHMKDNPPPATAAQTLGTAVHRMILEPNRVGDLAVWGTLKEEKVRNGSVWENFKELNKGALIVTVKERDAMVGMATAARKHAPIRKYASAKGPTEVSLVWTDKVTGFRMKCRLDKWIPATRTIFDLKSTRSCQPYKFGSQSAQLGYHIKMAIQWLGVKACYGVDDAFPKLGAVESKAPHESAVYRLTKDVLIQGQEELDVLLRRLRECEETDTWPAEMEEESDLQLPTWATPTDDTSEAYAVEGLELA
jgi:hypothetical protein